MNDTRGLTLRIDHEPARRYEPQGGCTVPGCARAAASRGLCSAHLQRWRRYGDTMPEQPIAYGQNHGPRRQEPLTCVCSSPTPDRSGVCTNRGCKRPRFSPEYVEHLEAVNASGKYLPEWLQ